MNLKIFLTILLTSLILCNPVQASATNYSTVYQNNFDSDILGSYTGFTNFGTNPFTVNTNDPKSGANTFGQATAHGVDMSIYSDMAAQINMSVECVQKVHLQGANAGPNLGIGLRIDGAATNGYFILPQFNTDTLLERVVVYKKVSGSYTSINNYNLPSSVFSTLSNGDFVHLKGEISGSTIRYKVWKDGDVEPSDWTKRITDSSISSPGKAGFYSGTNSGGQGTGPATVDDLLIKIPNSLTVNPMSLNINTTNNSISLTGINTNWTAGTPGQPVFTLSGGVNASIESQTVASTTVATINVNAGNSTGILTITDSTTGNVANIYVLNGNIIYQNNFDSDVLGSYAGFTNFGTNPFTVNTNDPKSGANTFGQATAHGVDMSIYSDMAEKADINVQFVQRVNLQAGNAGANMGVALRLDSNAQNGYIITPTLSTTVSNEKVHIFKRISGTYTDIDNYTLPSDVFTSLADGDFIFIRAQISGSNIKYKIWKDGANEPISWTRSIVNTAVSSAGKVGFYSGFNASQGTGPAVLDDLVINEIAGLSSNSASIYANSTDNLITLTGSGTNWTLGTPGSPTFTISGGTGASIASQTINDISHATVVLNAGSALGSLTITDPSTNSTTTISVVRPTTTIPVTNTNLLFSPYNWYSDGGGSLGTNNVSNGSSYVLAINPGAYFKASFTGTSVAMNVDTTSLSAIQAKRFPRISYVIDGGSIQTYQFLAGDTQIPLAQDMSSGTHQLSLWFLGSDAYTARWNATMSLKITGLALDVGSSLVTPTLKSKRMIMFGDSITEGAWMLGNHDDLTNYSNYEQAISAYGGGVANNLDAEYGTLAFGGQSWESAFNGDVPSLPNAWNYFYNTKSRLYSGLFNPAPDYLMVNMGTNGGVSNGAIVSNWLTAIRTATGVSCKIFVIIPFNGTGRSNITSGFNSYKTSSGDSNVFLIDLGTDGVTYSTVTPTYAYDGLHPNIDGHTHLAGLVYAAIQNDIATISSNPSSIVQDTTSNSIVMTGTNTSWIAGAPGAPIFILSGDTSATIINQVITDTTHATLTINAGNVAGTSILTDPSTNATTSIVVLVDNTPPSIDGLADDNIPRKVKTWTWSGEGGATFRYIINTNATSTLSSEYATTTTATQLSGNGTYYLHVQSKDVANNESEEATVSAILDNTPPVITVSGDNPATVAQGSTYADGGATATDNIDSSVAVTTSGTVDTVTLGNYTITYNASDIAGNAATPATRLVRITDQANPIISAVTANPSRTSAAIMWTTNKAASSKVEYGLTGSHGSITDEADIATRITSHSATLSDLIPCTTYHYRVKSRDEATNEGVSEDKTFMTSGCSSSIGGQYSIAANPYYSSGVNGRKAASMTCAEIQAKIDEIKKLLVQLIGQLIDELQKQMAVQ